MTAALAIRMGSLACSVAEDLEPALDRVDGHGAVRQLLGDGFLVDGLGVRHCDRDIDEHIVRGLADHPEKPEARMPDRIRHRTLGRFGGVPAVNVDAHAHFGDTANASHVIFPWLIDCSNVGDRGSRHKCGSDLGKRFSPRAPSLRAQRRIFPRRQTGLLRCARTDVVEIVSPHQITFSIPPAPCEGSGSLNTLAVGDGACR